MNLPPGARRNTARLAIVTPGILCGLGWIAWSVFAGSEVVNGQDVNLRPATAQGIPAETSDASDKNKSPAAGLLPPPPREKVRLLEEARALIMAQRYSEAIERLQEVLLAPDDYFLPERASAAEPRSLKNEADLLLRSLPKPAQELYQLQFEARAEALLHQAIAVRDLGGLLHVWGCFPGTQASVRAGLLAAYWLLQEGHIPEATRILQQVYNSGQVPPDWQMAAGIVLAGCYLAQGQEPKAEGLLQEIQQAAASTVPRGEGQLIPWFSDSDNPIEWLKKLFGPWAPPQDCQREGEERVAYLGLLPTRNGQVQTAAPLLTTMWKVRLADYPEFEELITHAEEYDRATERPAIPASMPLVVGEIILCRTLRSLIAVDAKTGKRLWESSPETIWEPFLNSASGINVEWLPVIEQAVRLRVWGDATAGGLSTDGQLVFVVEDLGWPTAAFYPGVLLGRRPAGELRSVPTWNTLSAYDIRTGKRRWQISGRTDTPGKNLEKVFFLGPPLPLQSRLYAIGYSEGEVRLIELEASSGKRLWQLALAAVDEPISEHWRLRTAGLSPSYHQGILVCPTGVGALVGVDILTRRLVWFFPYKGKEIGSIDSRVAPLNVPYPMPGATHAVIAGGIPLIAEDRVVFGGNDSSKIFCLELSTGRLIWEIPREDVLYIAGAYQGQAILVEPKAVRLVSLAPASEQTQLSGSKKNGLPVAADQEQNARQDPTDQPSLKSLPPQKRIELPYGGGVAGIGYRSGAKYFVPLLTGEIAEVDLAELRVVNVLRSVRPIPLGNLVACQGRVFSLSGSSLTMFPDAAALRADLAVRLAADPNDRQAKLTLAKVLIHEGKYRQAWEELESLWQRQPTPELREWLRETSLAGLRKDFEYFAPRMSQFEEFLEDPADRAVYLQLLAVGREQQNDWEGAWDAYRRLIELDWESPGWLRLDATWEVRTSHWLMHRLAKLYEKSSPAVRTKISQYMSELGRAAKLEEGRDGSSTVREKWLAYFFQFPQGRQVALRHAEELARSGRILAAEYWWNRLAVDEGAPYQQDAQQALLRLYYENQRWGAIAHRLRRHKAAAGDKAAGPEGETPDQLAQFSGHPGVEARLRTPDSWPLRAKVSSVGESSLSLPRTRVPISMVSPNGGDSSEELRVALITERPILAGFDGFGRKQWEFPISELADLSGFTFFRGSSQALTIGHLVVVKGQTQAIALNTLTLGSQGRATLVWAFDLVKMQPMSLRGEGLPGEDAAQSQVAQTIPGFADVLSFARFSADAPQPEVFPIGNRYVGFKQRNHLAVVNALTGERLWVRRDLPPKGTVTTDGKFIYVFTREGQEGVVYDAELGEMILRTKFPPGLVWQNFELQGNGRQSEASGPVVVGNCVLCREIVAHSQDETYQRFFLWDLFTGNRAWESPDLPHQAVFKVHRGKWLGVWYPDGRLQIYRLPDGNLLTESQLPVPMAEAQWRRLEILSNSWQLLALGLAEAPGRTPQLSSYPPAGVPCERISRAALWACDLEGRPMWTEPVTVSDCWLPVDQPWELPVLFFAWIPVSADQKDSPPSQQQFAILAIDRRTGSKVVDTRLPNSGIRLDIEGNPEQKTVRVRLHRTGLMITFTEQAADHPAEEGPSTPQLPGLLDLLRRAMGAAEPK
ncbi:MAG: PQQ-binding-like beta-propeller repeat protein [Thermoguttaceae bacterium]|nr:PQQ-binding-like beta-propeller repeat protein [Thermoguttaceae bacterium]MDW8077745.1 PQQ-binding-like beta-propeller repeat protein [Thermoguttaceae bacterium]